MDTHHRAYYLVSDTQPWARELIEDTDEPDTSFVAFVLLPREPQVFDPIVAQDIPRFVNAGAPHPDTDVPVRFVAHVHKRLRSRTVTHIGFITNVNMSNHRGRSGWVLIEKLQAM